VLEHAFFWLDNNSILDKNNSTIWLDDSGGIEGIKGIGTTENVPSSL
jgi:hypothetical protein